MERVFEEIRAYVHFREEDQQALRDVGPLISPRFQDIVDDFYERIALHPNASRVFTDGAPQIARLKVTLLCFLDTFFTGPWDARYLAQRARIGRRHVEVGLDQHYMVTALSAIREQLCRAVGEVTAQDARPLLMRRIVAINKLCDIELAIMLHTYRADSERRLQTSERLATFGELMSAICHELRNPLGVIETSVFLLQQRIQDDPAQEHMRKIQRHVGRCTRIITNMLDIVRDRPANIRSRHAADLAQRAAHLLQEELGRHVEVVVSTPAPAALADSDLTQQILGNLLHNAADATKSPAARIRLSVCAVDDQVAFLVEDNGPGIAPEVRARLFEPLVTTKEMGVGLGLALSAKLAMQQEGQLRVVSSELGGAGFQLLLPLAPTAPTTAPQFFSAT